MFTRLGVLALVVALAAPAAATHWSFYYEGLQDDVGETREDDGAVMSVPGSALDGRANRVVPAGREPGDGSLFLDMRLGNYGGTSSTDLFAPGPVVYPGFAGEAAIGRSDLLLPGGHHYSAWYGHWQDGNLNGAIDDVHDDACGGPCPADEFIWRGIGSGATAVGIQTYTVPQYKSSAGTGISFSAWGNESRPIPNPLIDRTSRQNGEQGWVGTWVRTTYDAPLLYHLQTLAIAGAQPVVGGEFTYDLNDPAALIDVDRYEAVSPELESLWTAALRTADQANAVPDMLIGLILRETVAPLLIQAVDTVDMVQDSLEDVNSLERQAHGTYIGRTPREPNHVLDDFEGRAFYGGVGDMAGSFNEYPGYAPGNGYHLFFDVQPRSSVCVGAYAKVPGTSVDHAERVRCGAGMGVVYDSYLDPYASGAGGHRTAGIWLTFSATLVLWQDANGDGYIGPVCDPESPDFDATTRTCPEKNQLYPHNYYGLETLSVCSWTDIPDSTFTIRPVGGSWPEAVVVRDHGEQTRGLYGNVLERPTGTDPVTLRWSSGCPNSGRDAILFPAGSDVGFEVVSAVTMSGYLDAEAGVVVGQESVTDVDFLPPTM